MATYRGSTAGGGTSGTTDRTVALTPAVGDLWVVFCKASGNTNASPTCSDNNGGSYTLIKTALHNSSGDMLSCFVRTTLHVNTTSTTVTVATGSNTAAEIVIVAVTGMAKVGAAAVLQSAAQANQAASTTPAPTFGASANTANMTLGAIGYEGSTAVTPPTNWTERQDSAQSTPTTGLEVATRDSGFTGTTITWGATVATAYGSIIVELDGSDSGTLSSTIAAVTSSAGGAVVVQGTSSSSVDAVTASAAGSAPSHGTLASTISAVTVSAASTAPVQGTTSSTIAAVTVGATGTAPVQGTTASTLDAVTSSATGTVTSTTASGTLAYTVDPVTSAATGALTVQGASDITLSAFTSNATGAVPVQGSATPTIGAFSSTSTGSAPSQGTLAIAFAAVLSAAAGTILIAGTSSTTVDPVTSGADGAVLVQGTGSATVDAFTSASAGALTVQGTANSSIDEFTSDAVGIVPAQGVGGGALDAVGVSATGALPVQGSTTADIGEVTISATGSGLSAILGSGAITLDAFLSAADGSVPVQGGLDSELGAFLVTSAGMVVDSGLAADAFEPFTVSAGGVVTVAGSVHRTLDVISAGFGGKVTVIGTAAPAVGAVLLAGGNISFHGNLSATIPPIVLDAVATRYTRGTNQPHAILRTSSNKSWTTPFGDQRFMYVDAHIRLPITLIHDDDLVTPTSLQLTTISPSGIRRTCTLGEELMVNPALGSYYVEFAPNEIGVWQYSWAATADEYSYYDTGTLTVNRRL